MPYGITGAEHRWTEWVSEEGGDTAVTVFHPNPLAWYSCDLHDKLIV